FHMHGARLIADAVERLVVVLRIVMKQHELLDLCRPCDPHAFLPRRMSPADVTREFVVGKIAVVDHEVNAVDEPDHVAIELARTMLRVRDVGYRAAAEFQAITACAAGMQQGRSSNGHIRIWPQRVAGPEIMKLDVSLEVSEPDGEQRLVHHAPEN